VEIKTIATIKIISYNKQSYKRDKFENDQTPQTKKIFSKFDPLDLPPSSPTLVEK